MTCYYLNIPFLTNSKENYLFSQSSSESHTNDQTFTLTKRSDYFDLIDKLVEFNINNSNLTQKLYETKFLSKVQSSIGSGCTGNNTEMEGIANELLQIKTRLKFLEGQENQVLPIDPSANLKSQNIEAIEFSKKVSEDFFFNNKDEGKSTTTQDFISLMDKVENIESQTDSNIDEGSDFMIVIKDAGCCIKETQNLNLNNNNNAQRYHYTELSENNREDENWDKNDLELYAQKPYANDNDDARFKNLCLDEQLCNNEDDEVIDIEEIYAEINMNRKYGLNSLVNDSSNQRKKSIDRTFRGDYCESNIPRNTKISPIPIGGMANKSKDKQRKNLYDPKSKINDVKLSLAIKESSFKNTLKNRKNCNNSNKKLMNDKKRQPTIDNIIVGNPNSKNKDTKTNSRNSNANDFTQTNNLSEVKAAFMQTHSNDVEKNMFSNSNILQQQSNFVNFPLNKQQVPEEANTESNDIKKKLFTNDENFTKRDQSEPVSIRKDIGFMKNIKAAKTSDTTGESTNFRKSLIDETTKQYDVKENQQILAPISLTPQRKPTKDSDPFKNSLNINKEVNDIQQNNRSSSNKKDTIIFIRRKSRSNTPVKPKVPDQNYQQFKDCDSQNSKINKQQIPINDFKNYDSYKRQVATTNKSNNMTNNDTDEMCNLQKILPKNHPIHVSGKFDNTRKSDRLLISEDEFDDHSNNQETNKTTRMPEYGSIGNSNKKGVKVACACKLVYLNNTEFGYKYAKNGKLIHRGLVNSLTNKSYGFGVQYSTNGTIKNLGAFDKKERIRYGFGIMKEITDNDQKLQYKGYIKNGKKEGFGIQYYQQSILPNGQNQIYTIGTFRHNLMNGKSVQVYEKNGLLSYDGGMKHGMKNGYANWYFPNGVQHYEGYFTEDKMDLGENKLYDESGELVFVGTMKSGKIWNGFGSQFHPNAKLMFEGRIEEGMASGNFVIIYGQDGEITYQGSMKKGNKIGEGTLYKSYNENKILYEGGWDKDLYNGQGVIYYDKIDTKKYVGEFFQGRYHGLGQLYWQTGNQRYEGQFEKGWPFGNDIEQFDRYGEIEYRGPMVEGKMDGYGTLYHPNGKVKYQGNFKNNGYDGKCIIVRYADGKVMYEGGCNEGKYHGDGKEYHFNGQAIYKGRYKNGGAHGMNVVIYDFYGRIAYEGEMNQGKTSDGKSVMNFI